GKMLRPTLLLLAYEAAGAWGMTSSDAGYLRRALPAAAAVELTHNFTLIHDDIEDGDAERRHRPTLWKLWGIPQAINAGDGLFAMARLALWDSLDEGVEGAIAARLGALLDQACIVLAEGQYLDISFEEGQNISVARYVDMIGRKKSLPVLHALEHANANDQQFLRRIYGQELPITRQQVEEVLAIFTRTETKAYCRAFLAEQCKLAQEALRSVPRVNNTVAARAMVDMA